MRGPFQILSDCPACLVEASLIELIDPDDRIGVALESECRLCLHRLELGVVVREGRRFHAPEDALRALSRWAREDGEEVAHFTLTNFGGDTPDEVAAALVARERVETGFDVVAFLFPGSSGGPSGTRPEPDDAPNPEPRTSVSPPPLRASRTLTPVDSGDASAPAPARPWDPRDAGRALATIVVADGDHHPAELRFLAAWASAQGSPPVDPADLRVWRPHELGTPPEPAALLDAMRRCALSDNEADGTEIRLLEEYARAWGVPLDRARLHAPSAIGAFWSALTELVVR